MQPKYKLIIFDFDGTLADTLPWFTGVINKVAEKYHFKRIELHEVEHVRGFDAKKMMSHLGVPIWKIPVIANYMHSLLSKDIDQISLFKGIDNLISRLNELGVILAVVSSNSLENVRHVLQKKNMSMFKHFECGVSIFGKSSRLLNVIKKHGIEKKDVIYIGDEIRDAEAAKKIGIDFGGVSWGYNHAESLLQHSPTFVFQSVEELFEQITRTE